MTTLAANAAPVLRRPSAWRRFARHRAGAVSVLLLAAICVACFATLPITTPRFDDQDLSRVYAPPSLSHWTLWFGTDALGRSLLVRTLYGGCTSLSLGMLAAAISVLLGVAWGVVAGYVGGRADAVMMRVVDVVYSLPYVLLVMLFAISVGPRLVTSFGMSPHTATFVVLAAAIGGVSWLSMARVIRGQVLSLRERPFVEAARVIGVPGWRIVLRHVVPNLAGPIIVFATLTVPQAILAESFLSFLGIGIAEPQATWGSLAADAVESINTLRIDWWIVVFPCAALSVTLLALNFVGDALHAAFDPKQG